MKSTRSYTMGAHAEAVAETRQRIIDALFDLGRERMFPDISLNDVAAAADVSVQTVLRHLKSRAGLTEATMDHAIATVTEERHAPIGDVDAAVAMIVEHYEDPGQTALLMLAQESSDPQVAALTHSSTCSSLPPTSTPGSCCASTAATRGHGPNNSSIE